MSSLETTQLNSAPDTQEKPEDLFDLPPKDPLIQDVKTVLFEDETPEVQQDFKEKYFESSVESILSREGLSIEDCYDPNNEKEKFLFAPDTRSIQSLESGSCKYKKVAMYFDDKHQGTQVLEKPKAGAAFTRHSIKPENFFKNSRSRYLFDSCMNTALDDDTRWNTVPTTIIQPSLAESKGFDIRSVSEWIPHDRAQFLKADTYLHAQDEFRLNVFRTLLAQLLLKEADACQHWMNMVGNPKTGEVFSIDNDQIGCDPNLMPEYEPHLVRLFHHQEIPIQILDEFQKFYHNELNTGLFQKRTKRLMNHSDGFHDALMRDIKTILSSGSVLSSHELNRRRE